SNIIAAVYGSVTDRSQTAADFTATGSPTTVAGLFGDALSLNGTSQYLSRSASVPSGVPLYMSALFKPNGLATGALACRVVAATGWVDELTLNGTAGSIRSTVLGNNASTATGVITNAA